VTVAAALQAQKVRLLDKWTIFTTRGWILCNMKTLTTDEVTCMLACIPTLMNEAIFAQLVRNKT
jgi:hypothetical protein